MLMMINGARKMIVFYLVCEFIIVLYIGKPYTGIVNYGLISDTANVPVTVL